MKYTDTYKAVCIKYLIFKLEKYFYSNVLIKYYLVKNINT